MNADAGMTLPSSRRPRRPAFSGAWLGAKLRRADGDANEVSDTSVAPLAERVALEKSADKEAEGTEMTGTFCDYFYTLPF
jgi:hypothetical protein